MFSPCLVSATYSPSFPGSDASAPVTCTPRTSTGSGRGRIATWSAPWWAPVDCAPVRAARCSPLPARVIPPASASTTSSRRPATAARRRRLRRRTDVPASAEALVRVQGWVQHGHRVQQCSRSVSNQMCARRRTGHACAGAPTPSTTPRGTPGALMSRYRPISRRMCAGTVPDCDVHVAGGTSRFPQTLSPGPLRGRPLRGRSTIRGDGALRPRHPAADRGRPDRHRPVRPDADAAVEPRRPRRHALPRLSQLALPVHRRQGRAGGADRARRGRPATSRSSSTPASSCSARRSSASRCPTTSSRGSRGRASLGRLGLLIHSTAGFIDPGFDGHVTLELSNVANLPITIYPGMKIGQLSFVQMSEPAETPYGSGSPRVEVPGPARADAEPLLAELLGRG